MATLRSSLVITFLSSNGATAVQFLVTVILARLLDPAEIGIYSITAVCISVAHIFRDFGVVSYLQREKDLTRDKVGAAFGVLLSTSWLIAASMFLLSDAVAAYYQLPGMKDVMRVLAMGFVFIPFGAITNCLLSREYRAKEQAYVRVVGTLTYAVTAIGLAYHDFSYMSLAWANLANIIATAIGFMPFKLAVEPWLPRFRGWGRVINFGTGAILGNSLNAINSAIPDVVLGKLSGAHDVGIMSRSLSTPNLINQVIGPTVGQAILPYLARAHHHGDGVAQAMAKGISFMTGIQWPAYVAAYIYATPLISVLYGERWLECAPIVQITCLIFIISAPFNLSSNAYMAIGRPYLEILSVGVAVANKVIFIYFLYDGTLSSFVWALVLATVLALPFKIYLQSAFIGLKTKSFMKSLKSSTQVSVLFAASAFATKLAGQGLSGFGELLLAACLLPMAWVIFIWSTNHPYKPELLNALQRIPVLKHLLARIKP